MFYITHRVPILVEQSRETIDLMLEKWESVPSDEKSKILECLIPEVAMCTCLHL